MSIEYCPQCNKYIDTDYQIMEEHNLEEHPYIKVVDNMMGNPVKQLEDIIADLKIKVV